MLVKEYRICMPMTVEEYRIAQLYMIQKKSREESTGSDSGVEILENKPYTNGPGGNGQFTFKIYHVGSHLPGWLCSIIPDAALRVEEEAWNAYPYTKTRYKVPFIEKFSLEIETMYLDDAGDSGNVFNMSPQDLSTRIVDYIDIVTDPLSPSKPTEDPSTYVSQVTGRGPLSGNWRNEFREAMCTERKFSGQGTKPDATGSIATEPLPMRIMCSYKVCRVEFRYWGMQSKIESFIQDVALRRTMVNAHRQAWTWQDEWYGLTMTEIRRLEAETAKALALKMGKSEESSLEVASSPCDEASAITANHRLQPQQQENNSEKRRADERSTSNEPAASAINFGSCMSFTSESERTSMFQSMQDLEDDEEEKEEDFFDAQSVSINGVVSSTVRPTAIEGIRCAQVGEVTQTTVLLFVVYGGCLQVKSVDESSKYADFTTFKSLLESTLKHLYPHLRLHVALELISCPTLAADTLRPLNTLDPATLEPCISRTSKGTMRDVTLIGNIPLLLTTSPHYHHNIQQLGQQLTERYADFRDSIDGTHFNGNVFVVADGIGSIMMYDLLTSPGHDFKHLQNENFTYFEALQRDIQDGPSLPFNVQDVFFLGSPLGHLLSLYRRLGLYSDSHPRYYSTSSSLLRPACQQVFNIFNLADPFAYRLEPLLDGSFERIPVVHLPTSACRRPDLWQRLREQLLLVSTSNGSPSDHNSDLHHCPSSSSHISSSLSDKTDERVPCQGGWWGAQRVDVGLHCPEGVRNILSHALPPLVHSSYWESKDASRFIIWQLVDRLQGGVSRLEELGGCDLVDDLGDTRVLRFDHSSSFRTHSSSPSTVSNPIAPANVIGGFSRQFRNSISNRLRFKSRPTERTKTNNPNHRANDAIVREGQSQVITARFTFGSLDLSSMANEEVEIYRLQGVERELLGNQVTDSYGHLTFHVPSESRLPVGLHRLQLVPTVGEPEEQAVELTLAVVPPSCDVVICSIDGSFAASLSLMGKDPKVRAGSVDIMRHWYALGYLLIYLSARPDMQHRQVASWLAQHNFPPGLTFFLDGIFTDPLRQKGLLLKSLVEQNQLSVHCAYGSAKDVPIYRSLGLQAHQIFAVGKLSRRQTLEATSIREGYASHFKELMYQNHMSIPATGPMSTAIKQNVAEFPSSSFIAKVPQPTAVFFDLPPTGDGIVVGLSSILKNQ